MNTALPPTHRKSQRTKLEAAGMRQCNRSTTPLSITVGKQQISVDLSHVANGTYFVRTTIGTRSSVDKLLKAN